jgi:hypothetical protein
MNVISEFNHITHEAYVIIIIIIIIRLTFETNL